MDRQWENVLKNRENRNNEEKRWLQVLNNRENYPELRFCKLQGVKSPDDYLSPIEMKNILLKK